MCRVTRVVESFSLSLFLSSLLFLLASLYTCARTLHARSKTPSNIARKIAAQRVLRTVIPYYAAFAALTFPPTHPLLHPRPYSIHPTRALSFDLISIKRVHTFCLARGGGSLRPDISESNFRETTWPAMTTL